MAGPALAIVSRDDGVARFGISGELAIQKQSVSDASVPKTTIFIVLTAGVIALFVVIGLASEDRRRPAFGLGTATRP